MPQLPSILIIGATFSGVRTACALAHDGYSVTLADENSFAGGSIAASLHSRARNGRHGSRILQSVGQMKMELYGQLMDAHVQVLFCARLCGILTAGSNSPSASSDSAVPAEYHFPCGALFATKFGILEKRADIVIDASEDGIVTTVLTGGLPQIHEAEYSFDLSHILPIPDEAISMPESLNLVGNIVRIGRALSPLTANVSFRIHVDNFTDPAARSMAEHLAHEKMLAITQELRHYSFGAEATVSLPALQLRPIIDQPARNPRVLSVNAQLPPEFSLEDRRQTEEDAVRTARILVSAAEITAPNRGPLSAYCFGHPVFYTYPAKIQRPANPADRVLSLSSEEGIHSLGLHRVELDIEKLALASYFSDAFVGGIGAGGAMAAWALVRHNADVLVADQFFFAGGTNTLGRVTSSWHGYNEAMYLQRVHEVEKMPDAALMDQRVGMMMYWERVFGSRFLGGLTLCGVQLKASVRDFSVDSSISSVLACSRYGFRLFVPRVVIDGSADGDLCAFASVPYTVGGMRDGMVQTSSMWGYNYEGGTYFANVLHNSDEDVIDPDSYADNLRGLGLGYLKNSEYEITPLCLQRESRRFHCQYALTMAGIARRECYPDVLAVSLCTHDTHGRSSSLMNQFGFFSSRMIEADAKDIRIRMPLRMFLPAGLSNVAIVGKSMSGEREAVSLCRMNPDVSNSGYAVGSAVAHLLEQNGFPQQANSVPYQTLSFADLQMAPVQEELRALNILPDWAFTPADALGPKEALQALSDPEDGGFSSMVQSKEIIVPMLLDELISSEKAESSEGSSVLSVRADNAARALAWHGCPQSAPRLQKMLRQSADRDIIRFEKRGESDVFGIRADGFARSVSQSGNYGYVSVKPSDPDFTYSKINQLLVLLGLSGGADISDLLPYVANAAIGELMTGRSSYAKNRIDGHQYMGDSRLWALAVAMERIGEQSRGIGRDYGGTAQEQSEGCNSAEALEVLLNRLPEISPRESDDGWGRITPPRVVQLKLGLARAAAHCGSRSAALLLTSFLSSDRAVFARFGHQALEEVFGRITWAEEEDSSASAEEEDGSNGQVSEADWSKWIQQQEFLPVSPYRGDPFQG